MPTMTLAKRKKDLNSPNETFSTLTDAVNLLKEEILVVLGHAESLGGESMLTRAKEAEDSGDRNGMAIALEDLQTRVDHLTTLGVMAGETLSMLVETLVENRVEEDAL